MKCQSLFSGKNKKNISVCSLLKILPSAEHKKVNFMYILVSGIYCGMGLYLVTCLDTKASHDT